MKKDITFKTLLIIAATLVLINVICISMQITFISDIKIQEKIDKPIISLEKITIKKIDTPKKAIAIKVPIKKDIQVPLQPVMEHKVSDEELKSKYYQLRGSDDFNQTPQSIRHLYGN